MASFSPLAQPIATYRINRIAYNRGRTDSNATTPKAHMKSGTLGHLTGPLTGGPAGAWAPLSSELEDMQAEYDVLVIGSGYGGGVASSRAARAGQKVCIIERGKEYLPGDFPESQTQGLEEAQITFADGDEPQHTGNALGMADVRIYKEVDVVLGCGLGGTSLINANVVMKPVKGVFSSPEWPKEVQADIQSGAMNRDFDAVEKMLSPQLYPDWYPRISKLDALQEASLAPEFQDVPKFAKVNPTQPGFGFQRTPIAVTFGADPQFENGKPAAVATNINDFGVYQPPCNNCGNCCSGCNFGSKNTVDRNYLPDAKNWGADIFTELLVSHIALAEDGKWLVYFEPAGLGREKFTKQLMFVRASSVFVAGGTLGSTEIMLRSKENGLALSDMVGKHYSGNGDTLGFSYKTQPRSVTIGFEAGVVDAHEPVGPCITGIIDLRNDVDTGAELDNQLIIEDGVAPGLLRTSLGAALPVLGRVDGLIKRLAKVVRPVARAMTRLVPVISLQNLVHVETFLVMSHDRRVDDPDESQYGEMHLTASGKLNLRWPELAKLRNYTHAGDALKAASDQLGGMFIENPLWRLGPFRPGKSVSVHSLGGCVMGEDGGSGAVNHKCQVFNGNTHSVHPGLYVCDGAVIPRSLGINPLFTISAMAERTLRHASKDLGWGSIDYNTKRLPLREPLVLERGVQFTETMKGFLSPVGISSGLPDDDKQPLLEAEAQGKSNGTAFAFTMTYNNQDVLQLQSDPNAEDSLVGTVTATGIEGLTNGVVSNGKITLFGYDMDTSIGRRMHYKCTLTDVSGAEWTLDGYKAVGGTWLLPDVWRDTTTLYTTLRRVDKAPVVWRGVLHILIPDLLVQLTTMKATNTIGFFGALKVLAKFFANFIATILATYTIPLLSWRRIFQSLQGARYGSETLRPLSSPGPGKQALKPEQHFFTTDDGQTLTLTRFKGGNEGPVLLGHGLGVSSLIFSTASVKENLLEALYGAGYDVFLVELRVSTKQKQSYSASNADEVARYDWPTAVEAVLNIAGTKQISVFAHCYGATTLSMSILGGFLDCSKVRSIVISQATAVSRSSIFNRIKAHLFAPNIMEALGYSTFDVRVHGGWYSWFVQTFLVDTLAFWFKQGKYPDTNAVSRRITFTYGSLYILDNLNRNTYAALKDMFGIVNMPSLKHLALMARKGFVVDSKGGQVYWTEAGRKRWTAPTFFLHGAENKCFLPIGSQLTMDGLAKSNGAHLYERKVFPGYGHIDCIYGKDAYRVIFPEAVKFFNKHGASH